jgi:hypothetical protein
MWGFVYRQKHTKNLLEHEGFGVWGLRLLSFVYHKKLVRTLRVWGLGLVGFVYHQKTHKKLVRTLRVWGLRLLSFVYHQKLVRTLMV